MSGEQGRYAVGRDASTLKADEEEEPLVGRLTAKRFAGSEDGHPRVRVRGVASRLGFSAGDRC